MLRLHELSSNWSRHDSVTLSRHWSMGLGKRPSATVTDSKVSQEINPLMALKVTAKIKAL